MSDHVDAAAGFESCFNRAFSRLRTEGLIEGWIDITNEVPGWQVRKKFGLNGRVALLGLVAAIQTAHQLEGASEFWQRLMTCSSTAPRDGNHLFERIS